MRRLIPTLLALLALAVPAAARRSATRPALWKLADADTTIYLFGTIHILPRDYAWRGPKLDAAMGSALQLTLEVVLDRDAAEIGRVLATLGREPGLPPLAERVPPAQRPALAKLVAKTGVPAATLDGMKTWAAAIVLTGPVLASIGLKPGEAAGVEDQLTKLFRAAGKPIDGLETPAQQLGFFDALPETAQREFLRATLDDPAKTKADFARMIRAWSAGDVAAIARTFAEEPEFTPALRDLLIVRRDRNWADALQKRLAMPGISFVAVGAGHLAGPDSVQRMLADKGLKVERLQ